MRAIGIAGAVGVTLCLPAMGAELFTCPVLPKQGEPFRVVFRTDPATDARFARFRVTGADGAVVAERSVALAEEAGALQASLELTVPRNGLLNASVAAGAARAEAVVPVLSPKREVHLVYYGMDRRLLDQGTIRWVTMVTSCDQATAASLRRRGAKPLRWNWGGNYLHEKQKQLDSTGERVTPELARQLAHDLYVPGAAEAVAQGYAGFGLDEFGDYPGSATSASTEAFVGGMIDARKELPDGFILAAWHAGAIGPELTGLYKQAVEFLLLESYLLDIVPSQLGTERLDRDMEGRLGDARAADLFTAPYGSRCRVLPTVDVTDAIAIAEYERFFRMMRREFPEVRGLGFFNVLSEAKWDTYRLIDQLCYDYYIAPVVTFQPDALYYDRLGSGKVTADLSNIGAMDSGPVEVKLLVDDREVGRATAPSVPAGFSRADNRAPARFDWQPEHAGTHRLRVEIVQAADATVLDPAAEVAVYVAGLQAQR